MKTIKKPTQQDIASFFGVKQSFISSIKRGVKAIPLKMAVILSQHKPDKNPFEWQGVSYPTFEAACAEIISNSQHNNKQPSLSIKEVS